MQKYFPFRRLNHREILLYGFHFNFLLIFTLAVFRDLYFHNYFNASVNFSALFMSAFSYYLLHFKKMTKLAGDIIVSVAVIPLYILIYFNHFENMVIIYVIFLPLAAFFLLEFKRAIVVNFFIYALLVGMLIHISNVNPEIPILNNPFALINIVFASILILVFGIFYHLAIDVSLSELIHSNRQKDILLKEVHHRVKNNLNVIASMLGLQAMGKNDETKEELSISKSRIESIAIVHEMLYKQDNFDKIVFNDYVIKLKNLILSMHTKESRANIEIEPNKELTLELTIMIQFGLIINEMLTNSLKYAHNDDGVKIFISLEKTADSYLFFYKDNGENELSQQSIDSSSGLGFKLIDLSVKQLDGNLKKYFENGLCYEVRFKNA